jgi:exodeoxyribonuclease VII large subunit
MLRRPLRSVAVDEPTFKVSELTGAVQAALDVCFPDEVWLQGEISSLNRSAAGHVYFQLVEPGPPGTPPIAQIAITLFAGAKVSVNATLKRVHGVRMTDGVEIRLRGRVGVYGPQGRLQVRMTAIDPEYTLGRLASERDRILAALTTEGVLGRNSTIPLAIRPRRIGLITSRASAAEADFLHELAHSGLDWHVIAIDVRVQGADAEAAIVAALAQLGAAQVDVIALVRGGGARTDLAAFDSELMARAIAAACVPVFTGIGHEIDTSVADLVAHTVGKTPTACAALLVARARSFHDQVEQHWTVLTALVQRRLAHEDQQVRASGVATARAARTAVIAADLRITDAARRLPRAAMHRRDLAGLRLDVVEAQVGALDPQRALQRGWSITRTADGILVRTASALEPGTELVTSFVDGEAHSRVTLTRPTRTETMTADPPNGTRTQEPLRD